MPTQKILMSASSNVRRDSTSGSICGSVAGSSGDVSVGAEVAGVRAGQSDASGSKTGNTDVANNIEKVRNLKSITFCSIIETFFINSPMRSNLSITKL